MMDVLKLNTTKLGNKIELLGDKNAKALIIGVFHGDEPQGKYLIENYLKFNSNVKKAMFIPCLNPDGMQLGQRTNASLVDLNRNFPTKNWELSEKNMFYGGQTPASEIETQFMIDVIEFYMPEVILTLHAPFKIVNYDGNAKEIAEKIAKIIDYPVEANIGYSTPGSFGTYCGVEKNIPIITLELDEICPVKDLVEPVNKIFDLFCK